MTSPENAGIPVSPEVIPKLADLLVSVKIDDAEMRTSLHTSFSPDAQAALRDKLEAINRMHYPAPVSPTQLAHGIGRTASRA